MAVGATAIIGGAALISGGVAIGVLGSVGAEEGTFAAFTAEYGLEEASHLVAFAGVGSVGLGAGAIYKARSGC